MASFDAYVEDIAAQIAAGYTTIRAYRATEPGGSFSLTGDTEALVAGQEHYTVTLTGGSGDWVRWDLYDGVSVATAKSPPAFLGGNLTLKDARIEAAIVSGNGSFKSACTANGTTTALTDATLQDQAADEHFYEGAWIYRPDAAAAGDRVRRIKKDGLGWASNNLVPTRAWTNAPADEEEYHVFNWLPPVRQAGFSFSWDDAVNEALSAIRFRDEVILGEGTATGDRVFDLDVFAHITREEDVKWVYLRTYDAVTGKKNSEINMARNGNWYDIRERHSVDSDFALELGLAPATNQSIVLDAKLAYDRLYDDDDTTNCPLGLLAATAAFFAVELMSVGQSGRYQGEKVLTAKRAHRVREATVPRHLLRGVKS